MYSAFAMRSGFTFSLKTTKADWKGWVFSDEFLEGIAGSTQWQGLNGKAGLLGGNLVILYSKKLHRGCLICESFILEQRTHPASLDQRA